MRKIDSLREALLAAIPELENDNSNLRAWVDRGKGQGRQTGTDSFALDFRLNVLAIGVVTDLSLIASAVLKWLRLNQPDLLQPGTDSFTFDADILDDSTADVLIQIELTQNYLVTTDGQGGETVEDADTDDAVLAEMLGHAGTDPVPDITAILIDGAPLLPADS